MSFLRSIVKSPYVKLAKVVMPIVLLVALFALTDMGTLLSQFASLSLFWIVFLMSVSVLLIYVSALKWGTCIAYLGEKLSIWRLFSLYLLGYFVNLILPSYLGGDAVRSWHVGKKVGQHRAAAATILERYTGLTAMIALGLVCMWFTDLASWHIRAALLLIAFGICVVSLIAMSPRLLKMTAKLPYGELVTKHLGKLQEAFSIALESRSLVIEMYLLSFLYHSLTVINTITCAYAIGWTDIHYGTLFVVLPLILLIGAVPLSPQGLGIQEGAFFYFLQGVGATPEQALGVALLLRAKSYVLALFGGIVWFKMRVERGATAASQQPGGPFPPEV